MLRCGAERADPRRWLTVEKSRIGTSSRMGFFTMRESIGLNDHGSGRSREDWNLTAAEAALVASGQSEVEMTAPLVSGRTKRAIVDRACGSPKAARKGEPRRKAGG